MTQFDSLDRSDRYKFEIFKIQAGGGRYPPKKTKIVISRHQWFDRSAQKLARLRILALRTGPAVKIKDGGRMPSLKIQKWHLRNGLTDRHNFWHDDALALLTGPAVKIVNV